MLTVVRRVLQEVGASERLPVQRKVFSLSFLMVEQSSCGCLVR